MEKEIETLFKSIGEHVGIAQGMAFTAIVLGGVLGTLAWQQKKEINFIKEQLGL